MTLPPGWSDQPHAQQPLQAQPQSQWQPQPQWQPQGQGAFARPGVQGQQGYLGPQNYPGQQPYVPLQAGGQFGYEYRPMPQYPTPQFPPPPRPPKRGLPGWMWVLGIVLVLAVVLVFTLPRLLQDEPVERPTADSSPGPTPTVSIEDGYGEPNTSSSGTFTGDFMVQTMNEALALKDHAAFFQFVGGAAQEPLQLWWDNMGVLQWTEGAFSVPPGQDDAFAGDTITLQVTLGAVTAGSPAIPADSDHPDAGKAYAPSNLYLATITVTDDGASGVITGWEVAETAAPWDLEPLYAAIGENSVTAGYVDERALVERVAPLSELGAAWVIDTFTEANGVANAQRFTTFVTEDPDRFNEWFIGQTDGWVSDRAGTMFPQTRPYPAPGISEDIATGSWRSNAGGVLTIGPNGLLYGESDTQDTIVHEFVHAMHFTNVPKAGWPGSTLAEGWAVYNESLYRSNGEFASRFSYLGQTLLGCLSSADFSGKFPIETDFQDAETVHCAYVLSGSMFAYAASLGVDVYPIADAALAAGTGLPETVAEAGGPVIDEEGWAAWVVENYG